MSRCQPLALHTAFLLLLLLLSSSSGAAAPLRGMSPHRAAAIARAKAHAASVGGGGGEAKAAGRLFGHNSCRGVLGPAAAKKASAKKASAPGKPWSPVARRILPPGPIIWARMAAVKMAGR